MPGQVKDRATVTAKMQPFSDSFLSPAYNSFPQVR